MLQNDQDIFFRRPSNDNRRVLIPAKTTSVEGKSAQVHCEDTTMSFDAGTEATVFYQPQREFMQQAAIVHGLQSTEPQEEGAEPSLLIELLGEPVSAESRACFRASTAATDAYKVTFEGKANTPMLDVSITGLAVAFTPGLQVGDQVDVEFSVGGKTFKGRSVIQSVAELSSKVTRYGVHCIESKDVDGLTKGLQKLSMAVQREQAQRRARAA